MVHITGSIRRVLIAASFAAVAQGQISLTLPSRITAAAVDFSGNLYIAGLTYEDVIPVTPGALQRSFTRIVCNTSPCGAHGFVAKINADGSRLLFATYLGGNGNDEIFAMTFDPTGNPILVGRTTSTDFPVSPNAYRTVPNSSDGAAFVTKLNTEGTAVLASTYVGGMTPLSVATDAQGSVYLAGVSGLRALGVEGFRATPGAFQTQPLGPRDGTILKLDGSLKTLAYATFLGGSLSDFVHAIAVDSEGNAYVTGYTESTTQNASGSGNVPFPATPGAWQAGSAGFFDAFVAKLNPSGSALVYSAVFGGTLDDAGLAIAVDGTGVAYVAGTGLRGYPTTRGTIGEGFATAVAPDGSRLLWTARIPGGRFEVHDFLYSMRLGTSRTLLIKGELWGPIQTTPDSLEPCRRQGDFVLALDADNGSLRYATVLERALALDASGEVRMPGSGQGPLTVRTNVLQPLPPQITCVANAADYQDGGIAPGEIVSLFGSSIGPDEAASFALDASGQVPVELAGVRLEFDGVPAPLLYVSKSQINAVVPFEIASRQTTSLRVTRDSAQLAPVVRSVVPAAPAVFQGAVPAILNEDGTLHSAANPARPGSVVSVYMTGAGSMEPVPANGSLGTGQTRIALRVSATIWTFHFPGPVDYSPLEVLYSGDAPGLVQGAVQIKLQLPDRPYSNAFLGIVIGGRSASAVSIFVIPPR